MNLAEFARWAIENVVFDGVSNSIDGGEMQDKAVACGLLVETKYDPEKHGGSSEVEAGDPWFVYSDKFSAALRAEDLG